MKTNQLTFTLKKNEHILELITIIFSFSLFLTWAIIQPYDSAPDECMRYDVVKYLFNHGTLPHGGDPEIRNPIWGISYAFQPYISGIISSFFMRFGSIFTSNETILIIFARLAVVMFGTITVIYVLKISKILFSGAFRWLFVSLIICLPQFIFLGSYLGNDMFALMSVTMIIYYWILGFKTLWKTHSIVGLSISLAICLLSYANAYPFVLMSIVFYFWSSYKLKIMPKKIWITASIITGLTFLFAGWWFIRNGIIYDGDLLALSTSTKYNILYAQDIVNSSLTLTYFESGYDVFGHWTLLWLQSTIRSFIAGFGYMSIFLNDYIYLYYFFMLLILVMLAIVLRYNKTNSFVGKEYKTNSIFNFCIIVACLLVVAMSYYYSYTSDYQAQGRYVIHILLPLMLIATSGIEKFAQKINKPKVINTVIILIIIINIINALYATSTIINIY